MRFLAVWAMALGPASEEEPVVWVFFSPEAPEAARIFGQLEGMKVRPVLLTERYFGRKGPRPEFVDALRVSGEVRVWDVEGLREARHLGISRLPAVAVVHGGRAHVAVGSRVDVREVMKCRR